MVATGVTFIILIGGIDLSVNGVMGLTAAMTGLFVMNDKNNLDLGIIGIIIAVLIAGLFGAITGAIFVKGKIPSFMVSFAVNSVAYGLAMLSYGALAPMIEDENRQGAIALDKVLGLSDFLLYLCGALHRCVYSYRKKRPSGNISTRSAKTKALQNRREST